MNSYSIYQDIAKRTGGDIYIGVVGPVRTGKSTFIQNFMERLVIPIKPSGKYPTALCYFSAKTIPSVCTVFPYS